MTVWRPCLRGMALIILSLSHIGAKVGDHAASRAEEATALYEKKQFEEALKLYRDAQVEKPESPELHFNVGDALVKTGNADKAIREFEQAATTPALRSQALYNMGTVYLSQQKPAEAVDAYKRSLQADPTDMDAKANLELALQLLEQQQQQQQQQSQDGKSEQQDTGKTGEEQSREREEAQKSTPQQQDREGEQEERPQRQDQPEETDDAAQQESREDQMERPPSGVREEGMSKEEAEQLLNALRDRDKQAQLRRLGEPAGSRGKDW